MQTKYTLMALVGVCALIAGAYFLGGETSNKVGIETENTNVSTAIVEDGIQYIDILAHGGYSPRTTKAKKGLPTIIRIQTENTYDCSIALSIPDIKYQSYLGTTGVTEIEVPLENTQGTLLGLCSMAMYTFEVIFE